MGEKKGSEDMCVTVLHELSHDEVYTFRSVCPTDLLVPHF